MLKKICTGLFLLCFTVISSAQDDSDADKDKAENTKRPSWSAGLPERQKQSDLNKPSFKPEIDNDIDLDMSEFGLKEKPKISIDLPINENLPVKKANSSTEVQTTDSELDTTAEPNNAPEQVAPVMADSEQVEDVVTEQPSAEENVEQLPEAQTQVVEELAVEPAVTEPVVEDTVVKAASDEPDVTDDQNTANATAQIADEPADFDVEPTEITVEQPVIEESIASVNQPNEVTPPSNIVTAADEQLLYQWEILQREPVAYPVKAAVENLEGWVEVEVTINPAGKVISASPVKYSRRGRVFGNPAIQSVQNWLFSPPSELGITNNLTRVYKIEFDL